MFEVSIETTDRTNRLRLYGVLDISTIDKLNDTLENLEPLDELVLDYSGLEFIDSTGIGAIIRLIYQSKEKEFALKFTGLNENIKEIFETVGVLRVLEALQRG